MKIAFLGNSVSIHTIRWVNALAQRGHEVHLITQHRGKGEIDSRVIVHHLPSRGNIGYFLNAPFLKKLLKKIKPHLLNTHYASGYGTLARLSGFHPNILSVWGRDVYEFPYESKFKEKILLKNLLSADFITSTSYTMAKQVKNLCPQIEKIKVIPFGVDTNTFKPQKKEKRNFLTIGTVKRFAPKYGIDILILGFAMLREKLEQRDKKKADKLRLLLVGGGPEEKKLKKLVKKLKIEKITSFVGNVPHSKVPNYLNILDIYVAVSRSESESFGVAVIEASACGLPVVVSDVGGLPEVVVNGVTGIIVPKENPDSLSEALLQLTQNEEMRTRMGLEGRNWVIRHYSWEENVKDMESLYQEILKKQ